MTDARLASVERFFARHGAKAIVAGLWALTFTGAGYLFAENIGGLLDRMHQAQVVFGAALAATVALAAGVRRRRPRTKP